MFQKPCTPQNCPQNLLYLNKCLSKCGDYFSPHENKTPWCYRKSKKFKSLKKSPQLQLCEQLNRELCLAASKSCCLIEDTATEWYRKQKELRVPQIDQRKSISAPCLDLKPNIREMAALVQKESIPLPSPMKEIKSFNYISPEFHELLRQHDERVRERYVLNRLPREYTKRRKRKKKEKLEEQPVELEKVVEWRNICSCEKIEFKKVVKKCQASFDIPEENVSCCGLCKKKKVKKEEGPKKPDKEDEDKVKCCGLSGKKVDITEAKLQDLKPLEKEDEDTTRFCGLCSKKPDKTEPKPKEPLKKEKAPDEVKTRFCGLCTKKPSKTETKPKELPKEKPPKPLEKEEDENVKCCGLCKKKREEIKPETPSKPAPKKPEIKVPLPPPPPPVVAKKPEKTLETPKPSEAKESKSRLSNCFKCFKSKEKPADPLQSKEDIKILPPPSEDLRPRYLNFKRRSSQIPQEDDEERDSVTEKRKINLTPRIRSNKEAKSYDLRDSSSPAVIELVKPQFKRGSRKSKERVKGGAYSIRIAKPVRGITIQRYKGGASTEEIPEQCTCAKPQEIWTKTHGTQTLKEYDNLPEWYSVQRRSSLDSEENNRHVQKSECVRESLDSGYRRSSLGSYDSLQEKDMCKPRYSLDSGDIRKTRSSLDSREYKAADEECKCARSSIESFLESPEYYCKCARPSIASSHQKTSCRSSQEYTKQALQCECVRSPIDSSQQRSSCLKRSSLDSEESKKESLKCECARSSIDSTQDRFSRRRSSLDSQECTNQSLKCECARSSLECKRPRSSLASKESERSCRNSTCSLQSQNTKCSTETLTQCQCKDIQSVSCFQQQKQKPNYLRMQGLVSSYWQHPTPYPLPKPKPKKKISCECNTIPICVPSTSNITLCSNNICHRTRSSGGNCQGLNKPYAGKRLVGFGNTSKARKSSSICTPNICDALRSSSPSRCSKVSGNFNICSNTPNICDCSKSEAQLCPNVASNRCECSQPATPNICACSKPVNCVSSNICECSKPPAQLCPSMCKQETPKICDCSKPKAQICPHLNYPPSCISPNICNCAKNICSPNPPSCISPNICNCAKDVCGSSPPPCNSPNICNCPPPPQTCSCSKPVISNCSPVYQQEVCISPNISPYSCDCPPTDMERYSTIYDSNEPRTSRLPSKSIAERASSMYNENEIRSSRMPSQSIAERVSQMYDQSIEHRPTRISSLRDVERLSKALARNTRTSNYSQAEMRASRMSRVPQERFTMVSPPFPFYYNTKICESYAQVPPNACLCPGSKSYPNISQAFCETPQQIPRICLCANEGGITKSYSTIPLRDSVRYSTRPLDKYENYELDEFGEPINRYSTRMSRPSRNERPTLQAERAVSWSPRMHNSSVFLEGMPDINETKEPKPSNVNRWSKAFRSQGTTRRSRKLANMRRSKSQNLNEDADYYTEDNRYRSKSLDNRFSTRPVDEYPRYSQGYNLNRYSFQPEGFREFKCSRPSLNPQFSNLREYKCDFYGSKSFLEPADFRECNCDIYKLRQSQNMERYMQPANFRECKCDISNLRQSSIGPSNFKECNCDQSFKNCECFPKENLRECNCPTIRQSRKSMDSYRPKECKCSSSYEDLKKYSQAYKECKCGSDSEDQSDTFEDLDLCECEISTTRPSRKKMYNSRANSFNNIKCCCSSDSVNQRCSSSNFISRKSKSLDKNRGRFNSGSDVIQDLNRNSGLSKGCKCKTSSYGQFNKNKCRPESPYSRQCKCGKSNRRSKNSTSPKCTSGTRNHRTDFKVSRTCKCSKTSSSQSNKKCDYFGSIRNNKCDCSSDSEDEETEECKCVQSKRNSPDCGEGKCQSSKSPQHCRSKIKEIEACRCNSKSKEQNRVSPACKCSTSKSRQSNKCIDNSKSNKNACKCSSSTKERGRLIQTSNACECQRPTLCNCAKKAESCDRRSCKKLPHKCPSALEKKKCNCNRSNSCKAESSDSGEDNCKCCSKNKKEKVRVCQTDKEHCSCKEESSEDECKCSSRTQKKASQHSCNCNSCNEKPFEDDNECKCGTKSKTSKVYSHDSKECKYQTKTSCPCNKKSNSCKGNDYKCKCRSKTKTSSSCNSDKDRSPCNVKSFNDECKCSSKSKTPGSKIKKQDPQELETCYYPSGNKAKTKLSSHDKTKSYTEFESKTRSKDKKRKSSETNKSSRSLPNTPGTSLTKNYTPPAKEKGKQSRSLNCFKTSKDKKRSQSSLEQYFKDKEVNQESSSSSTSLSSSRSCLSNECQGSSETAQNDSNEEKFCTCVIKGEISETSLKEIVLKRRRRSKGGSSGTEDVRKTQELKKKTKEVKQEDSGKEGKSYYNDRANTYTNMKSLQRKQEETASRCNRTSRSQRTNSIINSSTILKDIFVKSLEKSKENNTLKTILSEKQNPKPFRKLTNRNTNEISPKSLKNYSLRTPLQEIFFNKCQRSKGGSQNESKTKNSQSSEITQKEIKEILEPLTDINKVAKCKTFLKENKEQTCSNSNAECIPSPPKCKNIELSLYSATYSSGDDENSSISINEILSENRLTAKKVSDFDTKDLPNPKEIKVKLHRVSQSESLLKDKGNKIQYYTSYSSLNTVKVSSPQRFKGFKKSLVNSDTNSSKSNENSTTSFEETYAEVSASDSEIEIDNNSKITKRNVKETNESKDVLPGAASSKTIEFIYSPNSSRTSEISNKSENKAKYSNNSDTQFNADNENSLITLHRFREDSSSTIKAKESNDLNSFYSSSFIEAKLSQHSKVTKKESELSLESSLEGNKRNNDLKSYDSLLSIEAIKSQDSGVTKEESKQITESSFKDITKNIESLDSKEDNINPQIVSPIKNIKFSKDSSENSEKQTSNEEVYFSSSESEISSSYILYKNSINRKRYKGGASENPVTKKSQENVKFLENNQTDNSPEQTLPRAEEQTASAAPEHSEVKDHQDPSLKLKKTKKYRNLSMCCTRQRSQSSDSDTSRGSKKSNPLLLCFKDSLCCTVCRRKKKLSLPPPEIPEEIVIEDEPQPPAPKKCKLPLRPPGAAKFRALANISLKHLHCFKDSYYWLGIPANYPQNYQEIAKRQQLERERSAVRRAKLWGDKCPRAQPTKAFYEAKKTGEISPGHRKCFDVIDECDEVKKRKFIRRSPCPCKKHKHNCVGEERAKRRNFKSCPCHQRERMWQSYSISSFKSYESSTERKVKTKDSNRHNTKNKDRGNDAIKDIDRGLKQAITKDQDKEIQKKYSRANDQREERKKGF